jgi:signal transduction histidine kinase
MTKILVVDDVESNVTVLTCMLMHQGFTVRAALSGQEALDIISVERPDVILLDVSMPNMSGIDVCRKLKADVELRLIPVILVTARSREEEIVEGLNAGADDYIPKPVTQEILTARLRSALRVKSIYDELAASNERLSREISERAKAEEELRHAQKLELVGQLAGGIAHEFNNLLQAIEGYTAYAMEGLSPRDVRRQDLQEVLNASARASSLTRQLLGFSRRRVLEKKCLSPNRVVEDLAKMIASLVGGQIRLELDLEPDVALVYADPGELQQALLNLCLNARDAMPLGGTLTLKTEGGPCRAGECGKSPWQPRVFMHVVDTGCGMSEESLQRIFEPFYTTKEVGKGTGLGLANVYGVVRQHGGSAHVESVVGKGTRFTICLPVCDPSHAAYDGAAAHEVRDAAETVPLEGGELWPILA